MLPKGSEKCGKDDAMVRKNANDKRRLLSEGTSCNDCWNNFSPRTKMWSYK